MYTYESFCSVILRSKEEEIKRIIANAEYKQVYIPKKHGKRKLCYLDKNSALGQLQKRLQKSFFSKQNLPLCVKGFREGENYLNFLKAHIGSNFFVRIDIQNFFPSITSDTVKKEITNIISGTSAEEKGKIIELVTEIVCTDNCLPQGAITSPIVSNIVMARIDQRITKYCQELNVKYTRYADDLLFSSSNFDFKEKKWFLRKIKFILGTLDLRFNYSKIRYGCGKIILNGHIISNSGISLSRTKLSDVRHMLSFIANNFSYIKNMEGCFLLQLNQIKFQKRNLRNNPFLSIFQVIQYLCGYRAYLISMINNDFYETSFQRELRRLLRRIEKQITILCKEKYGFNIKL